MQQVTADSNRGAYQIPFRILFVGKNHLPHVGGSEVSTHHLANALSTRGHSVTVVTRLTRRSVVGLLDTAHSAVVGPTRRHEDRRLGYKTVRSVQPLDALERVLEAIHPNVVVVTGSDPTFTTEALDRCADYPTILYVRDAAAVCVAGEDVHFDVTIANSRALAGAIRGLNVEADFLPSLFPPDLYNVATTREKVLFVNPVPKKGVEIALSLADSRPDIPFVFSLSWRVKHARVRELRRTARRLGNVEIRQPTIHPRVLFRDCRLVLVPTQWPEAWCRVVSEAQISGIPAVASHVGGLPESVGPGGILVSPSGSMGAWFDALSNVWDDAQLYRQLAERARAHSQRPEMSVVTVIERFEALLGRAEALHTSCLRRTE